MNVMDWFFSLDAYILIGINLIGIGFIILCMIYWDLVRIGGKA